GPGRCRCGRGSRARRRTSATRDRWSSRASPEHPGEEAVRARLVVLAAVRALGRLGLGMLGLDVRPPGLAAGAAERAHGGVAGTLSGAGHRPGAVAEGAPGACRLARLVSSGHPVIRPFFKGSAASRRTAALLVNSPPPTVLRASAS